MQSYGLLLDTIKQILLILMLSKWLNKARAAYFWYLLVQFHVCAEFHPQANRRDCSSSSTPSAAGNARRRSTTRKSSLCLKLLAWASPCKVQHANMGAFPWILSSLFLFSHGFCGYIDPFCSWSVSETECQGHAREVASSLDLGKYDGIVCVSGDGVLVEVSGASPMLLQPVLCSEYLSA